MKLKTIWASPNMKFKERIDRSVETIIMHVAYRLPKKLVYWSFIHAGVKYFAKNPGETVTDVTYMDVLENLGKSNNRKFETNI